MVMVYFPGVSRSAGKLNWPLSLLTTVVVTLEPSFRALTRTPSIAPSSAEETWPLSAAGVWAGAETSVSHASTPKRAVPVSRVRDCMISPQETLCLLRDSEDWLLNDFAVAAIVTCFRASNKRD